MTHDLCNLLLSYYWHWHEIQSHQFGNPFFGTLAQPFHFRRWLRVCAVKTGTSYFGNLSPTCQQVLGHACHIWYSLSLTHNNSTRAGPVRIRCVIMGMFDRKWNDFVSWSFGNFWMDLKNICKFWSLIKARDLLLCNIIKMVTYNSCSQMLHMSLKMEKSFMAHRWCCCPLLALRSIQLMTGEPRPRYNALQ